MPIPKPKAGESQREFVQRCMSDSQMSEYDQEQRLAICYNEFRTNLESEKNENSQDIRD